MESKHPVAIFVGETKEAVVFEGQLVAKLIEYRLVAHINRPVYSTCITAGCFPRRSGNKLEGNLSEYPLRIYATDDSNRVVVSVHGTILGCVTSLEVALNATATRHIRMKFHKLDDSVRERLDALGVEVTVEAPQ